MPEQEKTLARKYYCSYSGSTGLTTRDENTLRIKQSIKQTTLAETSNQKLAVYINKVRRGYSDDGVIPTVGCLFNRQSLVNSSVVPQGRLSVSLPCGTTEELPNFVW